MIAYSEWCWSHDLQRREFGFGTKDTASVTHSFVWQKFYYSEKGIEKTSSLIKALYTFSDPLLQDTS